MYSRHVQYCPSFGSAMPHRGEVSVCTSRQDTTVTPFYVKNETFSGSSVGGFSLVNAGTTVSNVSSELQASNNTPALPSEEASFTIVNGKTYTFSTDYTNRTFVPGYTVSVLCEIKVSGTTVASQSMTALGTTYTFTYTATSSGTATIRYTFVMTGGPFPPPPPTVSFSVDNVKISFDSTTYSTSYTCSTSAASGYKYGFNGKEKDNEINVDGGDYDFGARIYDGRLGRWLSLDPLMLNYTDLTPYTFTGNSPIVFFDSDGNKIDLSNLSKQQKKDYKATIKLLQKSDVFKAMYKELKRSSTVITIKNSTLGPGNGVTSANAEGTNIDIQVGVKEHASVAQELFHSYQGIIENKDLYTGVTGTDKEAEGEVATMTILNQVREKTKNKYDLYDPMGSYEQTLDDNGTLIEKKDNILNYNPAPTDEELNNGNFDKDYQNYKKVFVDYNKELNRKFDESTPEKPIPGAPKQRRPASYTGPTSQKGAVGLIKLLKQTR